MRITMGLLTGLKESTSSKVLAWVPGTRTVLHSWHGYDCFSQDSSSSEWDNPSSTSLSKKVLGSEASGTMAHPRSSLWVLSKSVGSIFLWLLPFSDMLSPWHDKMGTKISSQLSSHRRKRYQENPLERDFIGLVGSHVQLWVSHWDRRMECSGWPDLGPVSTWTENKGGQVSKWKWKSYFFFFSEEKLMLGRWK